MPVTASRQVDAFDAVVAFRQISPDDQGFILEGRSPESGADRYVYIGSGDCERLITGPGTVAGDVDPALALRERLAELQRSAVPDLAPFVSGAVGYMGYEAVRHFEPSVGELPVDPLGLPVSAFFLPQQFILYDKKQRLATAVVLARGESGMAGRTSAEELLDRALTGGPSRLSDSEQHHSRVAPELAPSGSASQERHEARIKLAKFEIERGELIQAVLSQRVVMRTDALPIDVYGALSALNPSPYMFMLNFGKFAVVGCSPELMVRSRDGNVSMHPIAGTRPRGETTEQDAEFEAEMLTSEKERAEHVMLVDLARNDLGRVSVPGSVQVESFMATERYSHVMHLVSRVNGRLRDGVDGLDAFVTGFPLGTLTGAPRLRAIELVAELEVEGRGPYCGGVGWFDANGDVDTGTVIRCVVMRDGEAHIQAGGGIVFDSDPEREYVESMQKMAAQFEAIQLAESRVAEAADVAAG